MAAEVVIPEAVSLLDYAREGGAWALLITVTLVTAYKIIPSFTASKKESEQTFRDAIKESRDEEKAAREAFFAMQKESNTADAANTAALVAAITLSTAEQRATGAKVAEMVTAQNVRNQSQPVQMVEAPIGNVEQQHENIKEQEKPK